jgi:LmbE family N-acetylglucosaminyl deacetylase
MSVRAADALAAMKDMPLLSFGQLAIRGLIVVAPHPDDESLGCGGLIAAATTDGIPVRIVVVSDGAGSHPNSVSHPPARLRRLRESETLAAVAELGVSADAVSFLGLPDRYVPTEGPEAAAAIARIVAIAQACGAELMTVTWQHDPHHDHQAAFALARAACRQLPGVRLCAYPIWGWTLPADHVLPDGMPQGFRLSIERYLPAKLRAIAAHRSQISRLIDDDPNGFMLSADDLARFDQPYETYIRVVG